MLRAFITLFLVSAVLSSSTLKKFEFSCDLGSVEIDARYPSIRLETLEFQVSRRVTHQLATRVFAIFLKERLNFKETWISDRIDGYPIEMADEKKVEYAIIYELSRNTDPAINLETWVSPDSHVFFPDRVLQGGSLHNDLVRYGLFIQESFTFGKTYSYRDFIASGPTYHSIIKDFILDTEDENTLKNLATVVHNPQQCNSDSEKCAIVLTSYHSDLRFFSDHVDMLRLKMKIFYLEDKLQEAMSKLNSVINIVKKKKKYLVFHWSPSEIINGSISYRPLVMPSCDLYKNESNSCRYEVTPVAVFYNDEVKKSDDLMDIVRRFKFHSMKPLLDIYTTVLPEILKPELYQLGGIQSNVTNEDFYNEIACTWLKQNRYVYEVGHTDTWLVKSDELQEISIGGIFPKIGTGREYSGIFNATLMAQEMINANPHILPGYRLEIKRTDCRCKPDEVLKHFINYYSHRSKLVGVLGPSCSEAVEPIAAISKHFKMSVITYSAEGIPFDNREEYPYFFRTIGETKQYADVYEALFTKWNWKRYAALTEDGMKYTEWITNMDKKLKDKVSSLIVNKKFTREADKEKQFEHFKTCLKELKDIRAKIIIVDVHDHSLMKQIICAAYKHSMTAQNGYVWFLPVYVSMKMNDTTNEVINGTCTTQELETVLDGHFAMTFKSFGDDNSVIEGTKQTVLEWKKKYMSIENINRIQLTDYSGFAYDAVLVYAKALQRLIAEDPAKHENLKDLSSEETMKKLTKHLHNTKFQGVSGEVQFNDGGSRFTNINLLQWQKKDFVLVGEFKISVENRMIIGGNMTLKDNLMWMSGELPNDGRENCLGIFNADCNVAWTVLAIFISLVLMIVGSIMSFLFWKRKYDKKLVESEKRYVNYQIIVHGELTKWEVPRENVVINRRLGEGAFGTVYGGEALIDPDDGWTAVAIKTLKSGSTAENRLDFLAESETMKRFDHKNILRLLGVCLQSEPLYAIMEYMLYGDLKTYLLARRHLVNDKISDDSDISSKRLTLMALDVARGLSYLASLNYVHRDVACRNCMLNAQRVVKIGDFGMARPTFESDYYRFARKGLLPVRWMSPESVDGGIFSHGSDIWSYGVLLYEIVTLGAFPFQGLNNNQVFEHVKSGNSIKIPANGKAQLKALMSSCFSVDAKKRPGASTIVEFISSNPRMLTPCIMDVPKPCLDDQVNLIGDESNGLEILEKMMDNRDRSHTPANVDFIRTSVSSSALQNLPKNHQDPSSFEYLDMNIPKRPNGIFLNDFHPDLTATLPNGNPNCNYNPVEPLLQARPEISKSNLSLMKYMPMCGFKNSNRSSPDECTSAL